MDADNPLPLFFLGFFLLAPTWLLFHVVAAPPPFTSPAAPGQWLSHHYPRRPPSTPPLDPCSSSSSPSSLTTILPGAVGVSPEFHHRAFGALAARPYRAHEPPSSSSTPHTDTPLRHNGFVTTPPFPPRRPIGYPSPVGAPATSLASPKPTTTSMSRPSLPKSSLFLIGHRRVGGVVCGRWNNRVSWER